MSETVKVKRLAISHYRRYDELGRLRPSKNGSGDTALTKKDVKMMHSVKCAQSRAEAQRQMEAVKRRTMAVDVAKRCVENEERETASVVERHKSERYQRVAWKDADGVREGKRERQSVVEQKKVELVFSNDVVGPVVDNVKSKRKGAKEKHARPKTEDNRRSKTPLKTRRRSASSKIPTMEERRPSASAKVVESPRDAAVGVSPRRSVATGGRSRTPKKISKRTQSSRSRAKKEKFLSTQDDVFLNDYDNGAQQAFRTVSLIDWRQKSDGTISGNALTGERVRTSAIVHGTVRRGHLVEDREGNIYFLS